MLGRSSARKIDQLHAMLRWFRVIVQTGNLENLRKWKKFAAQIRDDYLLVPKYRLCIHWVAGFEASKRS